MDQQHIRVSRSPLQLGLYEEPQYPPLAVAGMPICQGVGMILRSVKDLGTRETGEIDTRARVFQYITAEELE